jgi:hypothetical protein
VSFGFDYGSTTFSSGCNFELDHFGSLEMRREYIDDYTSLIWAIHGNDADTYLVGSRLPPFSGVVAKRVGDHWVDMSPPQVPVEFYDVWVSPAGKVFAVGTANPGATPMWSHDAVNGWTAVEAASEFRVLTSVFGRGEEEVYAVGWTASGNASLQYLDGEWSTEALPSPLSVIGGNDSVLIGAGGNGTVQCHDGQQWVPQPLSLPSGARDLSVTQSGTAYAALDSAVASFKCGDSTATETALPSGTARRLRRIWSKDDDTHFLTAYDDNASWLLSLHRRPGSSGYQFDDVHTGNLNGHNRIALVGLWGRDHELLVPALNQVLRFPKEHWTAPTYLNQYELHYWRSPEGRLFAASTAGVLEISHFGESSLIEAGSFQRLAGRTADDFYALGLALRHLKNGQWNPVVLPAGVTWRALSMVGDTLVVAGKAPGSLPVLFSHDGNEVAELSFDGTRRPVAVGGASLDDFYVADIAQVWHYAAESWQIAYDPAERITSMWVTGEHVFVGTEAEVIAHYDGTAWSEQTLPGAGQIWMIHGSGPGDVFALSQGIPILHYGGDQWSRVSYDRELFGKPFAVHAGATRVHFVGDEYRFALHRQAPWVELP